MKRQLLSIAILVFSAPLIFAGGLKTNTNQSAAWARTLTREASTGIDAVYFNPAGLSLLKKNGLHLSVSNQSIFQTRTIISDYPYLSPSPKTYEAELTAPIYPSIYAAFKTDKWTFSGGFNIIGGGGTADFKSGLPSFEVPIASFIATADATMGGPGASGIQGYNMDAAFSGASTFYGIQLGATYAITDMISVAVGGRYVMANNSYEGSLTGVTYNAPMFGADPITGGNYLRGLTTLLDPTDPLVPMLLAQANIVDQLTADKELVATQKGSGFTPIVGVNVNLLNWINVGAKYEHHTKIELENETEVDGTGMFPDGAKTRADLPGHFSLGAELSPIDKLVACVGFNYFLDKGAYYGSVDATTGEQINNEGTIDENSWTMSASLQYRMIGPLGISAGYSFGNLGVNDSYQSDMSYANKSSTIAGGLFLEVGDLLTINAGYVHVMYDDYVKAFDGPPAYSDTYGKKTGIIAIGVDISL